MAPASAASPRCSACSIPAPPTSPSSTLTTVSARRASPPASTGSEDFAPHPCEYLRLLRLSVVFFRHELSLNQSHALSNTFITPGFCANAIAAGASKRGNVRVTSGAGSIFPERRSAIALAKGPHRDPTTVISLTTIGHVSTGAGP